MFSKPSLLTRIAVGKLVGLLIGAAGFFALPAFGMDDMKLRIGILFWYTAVGAFIGLAGVMTWHSILKMKLPWWFMGIMIGAWMNFLLILFTFEVFEPMLAANPVMGVTSPWWGVLEGALVGLVLSGLATLFGGEGPETVRVMQKP